MIWWWRSNSRFGYNAQCYWNRGWCCLFTYIYF